MAGKPKGMSQVKQILQMRSQGFGKVPHYKRELDGGADEKKRLEPLISQSL